MMPRDNRSLGHAQNTKDLTQTTPYTRDMTRTLPIFFESGDKARLQVWTAASNRIPTLSPVPARPRTTVSPDPADLDLWRQLSGHAGRAPRHSLRPCGAGRPEHSFETFHGPRERRRGRRARPAHGPGTWASSRAHRPVARARHLACEGGEVAVRGRIEAGGGASGAWFEAPRRNRCFRRRSRGGSSRPTHRGVEPCRLQHGWTRDTDRRPVSRGRKRERRGEAAMISVIKEQGGRHGARGVRAAFPPQRQV